MKLLILDDDLPTLKSMALSLKATPHSFDLFQNPILAVRAYEQDQYDAVITDIAMPGMNGIEVLKAIRAIDPNAIVILITGYASVNSTVDAVNLHANYYIRKPVSVEKLLNILEDILVKKARTMESIVSQPITEHQIDNESVPGDTDTLEPAGSAEIYTEHNVRLQTLGLLTGGIVHDFNNKLTVMGPYAEMIKNSDDISSIHIWAEKLSNTAEQAFEITSNLLDIFRSDRGNNVILNLEACVNDVIDSVKPLISKNAALVKSFNATQSHIVGNRGQIHQLILNLLMNAIDSIPENEFGTVTLSTSNEHTGPLDGTQALIADQYIKFSVIDTGCGMPVWEIENIFQPFYTTKVAGKGTGLGMAIIRDMVTKHQGAILVSSEIDEGTRVDVFLPVSSESNTKEEANTNQSESLEISSLTESP